MLVESVLDLIGNTPTAQVNYLNPNPRLRMLVKLEKYNPGGSIKDRVAKYMIQKAEEEGELTDDKIVIEPTSGNTGIGLALVCRAKGHHLTLVMPETVTMERRRILIMLGAKTIFSDGSKGMDGAEDLASAIVAQNPDRYYMPNQFANEANVLAHYETTAEEIWRDTKGKVTHFVGGIGTTGTLMGVSKKLKEYNPEVQIIAVQPELGTTISGLKDLQTQHTPKIWRRELVDEMHTVDPKDAEETTRLLTLREGFFVGLSSGAIFHVALKKAREITDGVMVAIAPDGVERYLSTTLCDPNRCLACIQKFGIRCSDSDVTPTAKRVSSGL